METPATQFETLLEKVEDYSKTSYELSKLKSVEMVSLVVTEMVSRLGVIIILSLFSLVLSIGIAMMLGEILGKAYYGFFIVAAFYLFAGIILHFFLYKWIKKPVSKLIITNALQL